MRSQRPSSYFWTPPNTANFSAPFRLEPTPHIWRCACAFAFLPQIPAPVLGHALRMGGRRERRLLVLLRSPSSFLSAQCFLLPQSISSLSAIAAITYLPSGTASPTWPLAFPCAPHLALFPRCGSYHLPASSSVPRLRQSATYLAAPGRWSSDSPSALSLSSSIEQAAASSLLPQDHAHNPSLATSICSPSM